MAQRNQEEADLKLLLRQLKEFKATELYQRYQDTLKIKVADAAGSESSPDADGMREYGDLKEAQGRTASYLDLLNWFDSEKASLEAKLTQITKPKKPNAQAIVTA